MNAPFAPPGRPREPFAAWLCDDTAIDALRPVVAEFGWPPERCRAGGLRGAIQALSITASPAILIVDLTACSDPLADIDALAEVCEPGTIVIALGVVNDVRLYRDLLARGIHDYLLKPLSTAQLREAIGQAREALSAPRATDLPDVRKHASVAVIGTRGGVGASTIATSLAWLFSAEHSRSTALLDLDLHFGTGALSLDLEPGRGLIDAIENPARIDSLFIERAMSRANDNLSVLSAEVPISSPLITDGAALVELEKQLRHTFDMSVIDLPRSMVVNFPHLLAPVETIVIVAELTLACARDTIRLLSWLKVNAPAAQPLIIVSKVPPGISEISKANFESSIERAIDHLIPLDQKGAANAARLGRSFPEANPSARASAAMQAIAHAIANGDEKMKAGSDAISRSTGPTSLLGLLGLGALLPGKNDPAAHQPHITR